MSTITTWVEVVECRNCGRKVFFKRTGYKGIYIPRVALDGFYQEILEIASVERCPFCGYCSSKIGKTLFRGEEKISIDIDLSIFLGIKTEEKKEKTREEIISGVVYSKEYRKQLNSKIFPQEANHFLCASLIDEKLGDFASAGLYALQAAWVCESSNSKLKSFTTRKCRERALFLLEKARKRKEEGDTSQSFCENDEEEILLLIDIARRVEKFEKAEKFLRKLQELPNLSKKSKEILEFQKHLVRIHDSKAYSTTDVENFIDKVKNDQTGEVLKKAISVLEELKSEKRLNRSYEEEFTVFNELSFLLREGKIFLTDNNFKLLLELVNKIVKNAKHEKESKWVSQIKQDYIEFFSFTTRDNIECFFWTVDEQENDYFSVVEPTASIASFLTTVAVRVPSALRELSKAEEVIDGSTFFLSLFYLPVRGKVSDPLGNTPEKFREMMAVYILGCTPYYVATNFRKKETLKLMIQALSEIYLFLENKYALLDFIFRRVFFYEIFDMLNSEKEKIFFEKLWEEALEKRLEIKKQKTPLILFDGFPGLLEDFPSQKNFRFARKFDLDDFENLFKQFKKANFLPEAFLNTVVRRRHGKKTKSKRFN
ncbi:MAG: hypothetical protein ABGX27_05545 [Desulfurobacteriaceae bacterium]